jgi:hypothetical protein
MVHILQILVHRELGVSAAQEIIQYGAVALIRVVNVAIIPIMMCSQ